MLHQAAQKGHVEAVKVLIGLGAEVNVKDVSWQPAPERGLSLKRLKDYCFAMIDPDNGMHYSFQ